MEGPLEAHTTLGGLGGVDEAALGLLEVDHVPNGRQVLPTHTHISHPSLPHQAQNQNKRETRNVTGTHISLNIMILQVKRVLPDVDADDGDVRQERVLVGGGDDLELLGVGVVAEPAPAGALDGGGDGVHFLLERCGRALARGVERQGGHSRTRVGQSHARLTIDAAKVGHERILERARRELTAALRLGRQVLPKERVVDMPAAVELECGLELDLVLGGGRLGVGLLGGVEAVDVGLVVLAVVEFHDLA